MNAYIHCHEPLLERSCYSSVNMQGIKDDDKIGYIYPGDVRRQVRGISSLKTVKGEQETEWDWKQTEAVGHN